MADRPFERAGQDETRRCGSCGNDQANGSSRRPGFCRLPKQEDRSAGFLRPAMQAPCRGQVEPIRIAVDLKDNRGKLLQLRGFLRDPQCVREFWRLRDQKFARRKAAQRRQAWRIGDPRLGKSLADADPEERKPVCFSRRFGRLQKQPGESKRESCCGARPVHHAAMNFGQRRFGQTAAEDLIELCRARFKKAGPGRHSALPQHHRVGICLTWRRCAQKLRQGSLDLRDFAAQGKNSFPRHGGCRHDGLLFQLLFLLCSYRFQRLPEESSMAKENLFL